MAATVYFLLATIAFVQVFGDAPANSVFQELIKDGKEKFDKAMDDFAKLDVKEFGETVKVHIEKFSVGLTEFGKQIDEQVKSNPDISHAMKNLKTKIDEAVDKLKKDNPEIAQNAEKLSEAVKGTWDSLAQEMERNAKEFSKKGGPMEKIQVSVKEFWDETVKTANDLATSVDKMMNKKN